MSSWYWYRPRVNPLNIEAAVGRCVLVCARSMGWWSQVVSGVVTLGCLSPRPRLCAPVGACRRVQACVYAGVRLCVCARVPIGVVWRGVWPLGVWWLHTLFAHWSLAGVLVRSVFVPVFDGVSLGSSLSPILSSLLSSLLSISLTIKNVI